MLAKPKENEAERRVGKGTPGCGWGVARRNARCCLMPPAGILRKGLFLTSAPTRLSPKGAGRIQSLRAYRRAGKRGMGKGKIDEG